VRTIERHYGGVVSRGIAIAIDLTIAEIVAFAITAFWKLLANAFAINTASKAQGVTFLLLVPIVFGVYCVLFWTLIGRTPGKALLKLRVVSVNGNRPHLVRSIVRYLGYFVSSILMIGFAWAIVDRRSQAFQDKMARTFVVFDE
jgi:uncharacterized RDD family membrane protein YckC